MRSHLFKMADMVRKLGFGATAGAFWARALARPTFSAPLPGDRRHVTLRFGTTDYAVYSKILVEREYAFPPGMSPSVIVDAGANIGLSAVFFALEYPSATVIAIEPEAENFALLCSNTRSFHNVRPVQAALWSEVAHACVVDPGLGPWGFRVQVASDQPSTVPTLTVESVMQEFGLACIDILKIDIEGAEREVFASASGWIGRVGSVVTELHESFSPGATASFLDATAEFDFQWTQGENVFVARAALVPQPPPNAVGRRDPDRRPGREGV